MPATETIIINGQPLLIEKTITTGDLLISSIMTALLSVMMAYIILSIFRGR